jgi:predicted ATP-dependent endonuclease of OLD family
MKLEKITIHNFRSIEEVVFDNFYQNKDKNERAFNLLIGLNESGKSSILQSISNIYGSTLKYEKTIYKPNLNSADNNEVEVKIYFQIDAKLNKLLKEKSKLFAEQKGLNLKEFDDIKQVVWNFELSASDSKNNRYYLNSSWYKGEEVLESIKDEHDKFLWKEAIEPNKPKIIYWSYSDEFLLPSSIDLNQIINKTVSNKPIENIFKLAKLDINNLGDLKDASNRKTIGRKLESAVNKHFKNVWKSFEANVDINIDIESTGVCTCLIEDKDNKNTLFDTKDRSDGFRQFVSFILSVSCEEVTKEIENSIILLDEPEVHLHPSGIQFLRDRLIGMSRNNVIICATHSPFMIDKTTPESHVLVSKKKGKTGIERIKSDSTILSDEVMRVGFGLNYWKELLPQHIVLVEGNSDKIILNKVLETIGIRDVFIQSCNGSEMPKMYRYATIDRLNLTILHDDDTSGSKIKKQIQAIAQEIGIDCDNLLSIRDVLNTLPAKSVLEDILDYEDINPYKADYDKSKGFAENTSSMSKESKEQLKKDVSNNYKYNNQAKMKSFIDNLVNRIIKKETN